MDQSLCYLCSLNPCTSICSIHWLKETFQAATGGWTLAALAFLMQTEGVWAALARLLHCRAGCHHIAKTWVSPHHSSTWNPSVPPPWHRKEAKSWAGRWGSSVRPQTPCDILTTSPRVPYTSSYATPLFLFSGLFASAPIIFLLLIT